MPGGDDAVLTVALVACAVAVGAGRPAVAVLADGGPGAMAGGGRAGVGAAAAARLAVAAAVPVRVGRGRRRPGRRRGGAGLRTARWGARPAAPGLLHSGFDLSVSGDHTAVVVAHLADEDGRRTVVVDRLEAWVPRGGRQVDLADVEAWISQAARDYNSATVAGDPYQAVSMIQRLREAGLHVKPVTFSAGANSKRAQMLLRLVRDRCLDLPDDRALRTELLSLRLAEGATPGTLKLTADTGTGGHHDRVTALMIAAEHLLGQTGGSWLGAYGLRACGQCGEAYRLERDTCLHCGADNPDAGEEPAGEAAGEGTTAAAVPQPATVSAWGVAKCENGHPYFVDRNGGKCPTCHRGTGLPRGGLLAGLGWLGGFR